MTFNEGQRVNHDVLGNGTITKIEKREHDLDLITVEFDSSETTREFDRLVDSGDGIHKVMQKVYSKAYLFNSLSLEGHLVKGDM